jgi:hypothetical protein
MKKEVIAALVLATVLITALFAFWIIVSEEPIGKAPQMPKKLPRPPQFPTAPIAKPTISPTSTPLPTSTPTEPTPSISPSPYEEPTPHPFKYEMIKDYCETLRDSLTERRPALSPYCTGTYEPSTGEWQFMVGFTWTFGN